MRLKILVLTSMVLFLIFPLPSQATTITFNLNFEFSGGTQPSGPPPWLVATFDDSVGPDKVRLTMSASGLVGSEFVDGNINANNPSASQFGWGFNFNPAKDLSSLTFSFVSGNDADGIQAGANAFKADGDGSYDILFAWDAPPGSRLAAGQSAVYDIAGITGLVAADFDFISNLEEGNGTQFHTAAHVQGIGPEASLSGFIGDTNDNDNGGEVPEPMSLILLGGGLAGAGLCRRLRKTRG